MVVIKKNIFRNETDLSINQSKDDIICQIIDWNNGDFHYSDDDNYSNDFRKNKDKLYEVRAYGISEQKYSICIHIKDFKPFLYVRVPDNWTQSYKKKFEGILRGKLHGYESSIYKCRLIKRKELYGFHNEKKFKFIEIKCVNIGCFYEVRRILEGRYPFKSSKTIENNGKCRFRLFKIGGIEYDFSDKLYETNIIPLLRFFHDGNLNPAGWIKIPARKYEIRYDTGGDLDKDYYDNQLKQSRCQLEISCSYKDIQIIEKNDISPLVILSFDIECTSMDGSFPKPNRRDDQVIQIGSTVHKYGEKTCCYKNIITLKKCDKIDGINKVKCCENERKLLLEWAKLVNKIDPDIITGYNIWGFDMLYMDTRCVNGCGHIFPDFSNEFYRIYSRNKRFKIKTKYNSDSGLTEKTLASSALGQNFLKYWNSEGLVSIDMFKLIQKDYNLGSYKLDNVSKEFISGVVNEVKLDVKQEVNELTIKSNNIDGLTDGQYVSFKIESNKVNKDYIKTKFRISHVEEKQFTLEDIDVKKLFKLDSEYEKFINNELKVKWFQNKVDLSPLKLFDNYKRGTKDDIKEIAVYCVKDCELVNFLIMKLGVIANNIGAANVCCVPFSYLFLRGQGIKIYSCFAKECRKKKMLIKILNRDNIDKSGYEGAIVFKPKPGIYFEPIAVMDYASLYPSSMIAENISHETLVTVKEYDLEGKKIKERGNSQYIRLENYNYNEIEYDVFEGVGDEKRKIGKKICTFAEKKDGSKGLIPTILKNFLKARKDTRSSIKYKTLKTNDNEYIGLLKEKDDKYYINKVNEEPVIIEKDDVISIEDSFNDFQKAVLDGLQAAYKVVCNSVYGQVGAPTSQICCKELAASTTATGRKMLILARDYTLEKYKGSKLVYGDSILGDEPLLLRKEDGTITIKTIESLSSEWEAYEEFKPFDSNRKEKQQAKVNYEIWSKNRWTKVKRVIRHKTCKKIYRVNSHCGVVDVTEDHSLLNEKMEKIKPEECIIGKTKLAHGFPLFNNSPVKLDELLDINEVIDKEAFLYGFFFGDGSCGHYDCKSGMKYSWALNNQDLSLLEICKEFLFELYGDNTNFKILETMSCSNVYKLVPKGSIKYMVNIFKKMYNYDRLKIVPDEILNGDYYTKLDFFRGYYMADGDKCINSVTKNINFSNKGKIGTAHLYYIVSSLGYNCSVSCRKDKLNIFRLRCSVNKLRKDPYIIKKMIKTYDNYTNFVYDIETEQGYFNAGTGSICIKNTDSIFVSFKDYIIEKHGELDEIALLQKTIEIGQEAGKYVTSKLKRPQDLEYEKTFYPFAIFSKKRYFGNKYEINVKKYKQTSMGIVLKRRDNAPIVKDIYGGVIDILLNKKNMKSAVEYYKKRVKDLLAGGVDMDDLVITKSIKSSESYSNPTQIAHRVLADRIGFRDPGNKPRANDRIPYCYIDVKSLKCEICKNKVNRNICKCLKCMKLYCSQHLHQHKSSCVTICRFYKQTIEQDPDISKCRTCCGWYSSKAMDKHHIRKDKYGIVHYDKCKRKLTHKLLQGDFIEYPSYIEKNNIKLDYRYYLDHQIQKPVMQIFQLVMENPSSITKEIIIADDNRRNGMQNISKWFKVTKTI